MNIHAVVAEARGIVREPVLLTAAPASEASVSPILQWRLLNVTLGHDLFDLYRRPRVARNSPSSACSCLCR